MIKTWAGVRWNPSFLLCKVISGTYSVYVQPVCSRVSEMGQTREASPANTERPYVICFSKSSKFWDVCYRSSNAGDWLRPDGAAPQFSPSYWVACSGDASGTNSAELLNFFASAQS